MTLPEVLLWKALKANPDGPKFRRQHPIGPYIADLYCAAAKLVVEVDGIAHDMGERPARDETRTAYLEAKGYTALRIAASEVLKDVSGVAASIVAAAKNPPRAGEVAARSDDGGGSPPARRSEDVPNEAPLRPSLRSGHLPVNGED